MSDLLDVSDWLPLVAPDHVHAVPARHYWDHQSSDEVAFCRVTALAFLRHLTIAHIMQHGVLTGREAWDTYLRWRSLPEVVFLADPDGTDDQLQRLSRAVALGPRLWTDAHLAAFALAGGHRLITFDGDFARFPGLSLLQLRD